MSSAAVSAVAAGQVLWQISHVFGVIAGGIGGNILIIQQKIAGCGLVLAGKQFQ